MSDEQKTGDETQQGGHGEVPVKSSTPENAEGQQHRGNGGDEEGCADAQAVQGILPPMAAEKARDRFVKQPDG